MSQNILHKEISKIVEELSFDKDGYVFYTNNLFKDKKFSSLPFKAELNELFMKSFCMHFIDKNLYELYSLGYFKNPFFYKEEVEKVKKQFTLTLDEYKVLKFKILTQLKEWISFNEKEKECLKKK